MKSCLTNLKQQAENDKLALEEASERNERYLYIIGNLPECLPEPTKIHEHVCYADVEIVIKADSLNDAMTMAERSNPLNIFKFQDGCCSFRPECQTNFNKPSATTDCIGPWFFHVDGLRDHCPHTYKTTLEWFICVGDYIVKVECLVDIPHKDLHRDTHITFDRNGNARKHKCDIINNTGHFLKTIKWYAGDEYPNSFTLY